MQDVRYSNLDSVIVCPLTSSVAVSASYRVTIEASEANGFEARSAVVVDKTVAVSRTRLGERVGHLGSEDMSRVHDALSTFLDLVR